MVEEVEACLCLECGEIYEPEDIVASCCCRVPNVRAFKCPVCTSICLTYRDAKSCCSEDSFKSQ